MSFSTMLYRLLIAPLELLFEIIFSIAFRMTESTVLSIVFLSLAVNILVLPLYRRADAIQEAAREKEKKLEPWVKHIKSAFKGDERFMILQTYYRQNQYRQIDVLKGSISLLLEIPFFIAAYNFLSKLDLLQGQSLWIIPNMARPDSLFTIGGFTVNVLPILMTLINLVSASIYLKGFPLKSKIQTFGMAFIFLFFLYTSPSGLVFYWTLNNIFSLVKNIFYKLKHPMRWIAIISGMASAACVMSGFFAADNKHRLAFLGLAIILLIPVLMLWIQKKGIGNNRLKIRLHEMHGAFVFACVFLTLLIGVLIPSAVVNSSPAEFVDNGDYQSPLWFVLSTFLISAGFFLVWMQIFYGLANPTVKRFMEYLSVLLSFSAIVNYMFFGGNYGTLSSMLRYDVTPDISGSFMLINLGVCLGIAALILLIMGWKPEFLRSICLLLCVVVSSMAMCNIVGTSKEMEKVKKALLTQSENEAHLTLSQNGKNVVLIMLDRAASLYVPFIMEEKPDLVQKFDGFTYYPQTISYGTCTNYGAPGLYGGYEYTPEKMNERNKELIPSKHNEALKVMPVLFMNNGYKVTVLDPPYAGYQWIPDVHIYDDYPDIEAFNSMTILSKEELSETTDTSKNAKMQRNFFCYSLMKAMPVVFQPLIYNYGEYNAIDMLIAVTGKNSERLYEQVLESKYKATGENYNFESAYRVLDDLDKMTWIREDDNDYFTMMCNDTTHNGTLLQLPDYTPSIVVDNTDYQYAYEPRILEDGSRIDLPASDQVKHYHINMAAFLKLGEWFDYLKENDVYDNTRIIIVSDHSWHLSEGRLNYPLDVYPEDTGTAGYWDVEKFHCLLMVKDFDAKGYTVDTTYMTNADTPVLALEDINDDPVNPFTGKRMKDFEELKNNPHLAWGIIWDIALNQGYTFTPDYWFTVHGDVSDLNNWEYIGHH